MSKKPYTSLTFEKRQIIENMAKKKELWEYVKKTNPRLYIRLRFGFLGQGMNLPGKGGRQISIAGYKIAQKFFGFN